MEKAWKEVEPYKNVSPFGDFLPSGNNMNEQYLEWLFLRELLKSDVGNLTASICDIKKMENRYAELTKELLKDYKL